MPIVPAAEARWFLTALDGPRAGTVWPIAGAVTIGRAGDIPAEGRHVSREHIRIRASDEVRARAVGTNPARVGRHWHRRLPSRGWRRLSHRTIIEAGNQFRLERRPHRRSRLPWLIAGALLLAALLIPFLANGPAWRWFFLLAPALLLTQAFRRKSRRLRPLRSPLAILVSSHEGRAFHSEPHVPVRALRGELAGSGWAVRSEAEAIWLAGYLATWNDPDVLAVASPWVTTHGTGLLVSFGATPPARDAVAITWARRPQWALPLRLPRGCRATTRWAGQLCTNRDPLPIHYLFAEASAIAGSGLSVALGRSDAGPVQIDLARAPHALVAGATGSGKSELLTSWLLLMAARLPPTHLNIVLIDFKGGATSDTLAELPHVADTATDLDPASAQRIITSLRAALRERERVLAAQHARDISELDDPPPRLVIVVDEFRALADDVPDTLDQLVRLAAQGRSLGVHMILATQRPSGAVTPDMRANIPLRIALRATESADSHDLIGTDAAARLAAVPGRAVVVDGTHRVAQIAWTPDPAAEVAAIRRRWAGCHATPPWLPALPARLTAAPGGVALVDEPEHLRRSTYVLPTAPLLVVGAHGRGLSTTARACAAAARQAGERCWLIGTGGDIEPRQTRLVLRSFELSKSGGGRIVLDGVEDWAAAHDALHGPAASEQVLESLIRSGARPILLTHDTTPRWGRGIADRIVLAGLDRSAAALAGLDRDGQALLQSPIRGRAVIDGHMAQVSWVESTVPEPDPALRPLPLTARLRPQPGTIHLGHDGEAEVRIPAGSIAVVGPRGSGRTETALMIATQLAEAQIVESPAGSGPVPEGTLIATATPDSWSGAFGGVLGHLRGHAPLLVLRPDLCPRVAPELAPELEPGSAGCAVLIDAGRARAVRLCRRAGSAEVP
ncbi:FtsK/SpoIIIE family protein [Ruaniaceae bacterium KH17]|nr:FtsK/SpoIIIE family protein [Ruaniaceae bacterium KH17]